jgi:hypothetical protein
MIQKITNFEIKSFTLILKIKEILFVLEKVPFVLFFYYDFFNSSERLLLRKFLNENTLKTLFLKNEEIKQFKNFFKVNKFTNLLLGNTLFIYNSQSDFIPKNIIKTLISHPKLTLLGGKWYNKIYRRQHIEKYIQLDDLTVQKSLIKELIQVSYSLKNIVSRL